MKVWVLGSGSNGNAVVVEGDGQRVLIDAGFGPRALTRRLRAVGLEPQSISACLITHEHSDHVSGLARAVAKWRWPVYTTAGTARGADLSEIPTTTLVSGEPCVIGRLEVLPVGTSHDATESVGFVLTARESGTRAAVFYDMGVITERVRSACRDVDILVLEANHDDVMLRHGPYPRWLQERIAGATGHLSNARAAAFLPDVVGPDLRHVVLAHLSEKCNAPATALRTVGAPLRRTRFRGRLTVSSQGNAVGPFEPRSRRGSGSGPMQMALEL